MVCRGGCPALQLRRRTVLRAGSRAEVRRATALACTRLLASNERNKMDPIARMYKQRDERGLEAIRHHKKPPQRFRASELGDCKRKVWYRMSGYAPTPDTGFKMDWSIDGDVHHDIIRQCMLAEGLELAGITQNEDGTTDEDMFITHDFMHEGRTLTVSTRQDGWIKHDDYGWMVLEIKSVSHWKYKYMNDAFQQGGHDKLLEYLIEKYPNYIYQVHAGMAIANARKDDLLPFDSDEKHTLDHAYLLIKDRSNCHIGFHGEQDVIGGVIVPFDQETWDKVLRRMYITKGKVLDGTPPRPEYTSSSRECSYCQYRYACHDAIKRRKKGQSPAVVYPVAAAGITFNDDA